MKVYIHFATDGRTECPIMSKPGTYPATFHPNRVTCPCCLRLMKKKRK